MSLKKTVLSTYNLLNNISSINFRGNGFYNELKNFKLVYAMAYIYGNYETRLDYGFVYNKYLRNRAEVFVLFVCE